MAGKRLGFESPKLHQIRIYLLLSQKTHKRLIAVSRPFAFLCRPRGQKCGSNLLRPILIASIRQSTHNELKKYEKKDERQS